LKGKISFYHPIKGYGFIKTENGEDIFFHISGLEEYNPPQINQDQEVEFDLAKSEKGDKATNIKKIGKEVKRGRK